MSELKSIDHQTLEFGEFYDELPLWSAHFGLLLLDRVPVRSGQTILDVGAGTGFLTIELAQRCFPSNVIAVDPWKAATARLRKKIAYLGLENIQVVDSDAASLDLPDASVDLIVSNLGINNFDNAADVLRTCHRVARPGARLIMTSNLVGTMRELYDTFRELLRDAGSDSQLQSLEAHIGHRATLASLRDQLNDAGFHVVNLAESCFRLRFASGTAMLRHFFMRVGFVPAWREIAATGNDGSLFDRLEQRLNDLAASQGELSLTVPTAIVEAEKPGTS